MILEVTSEQIAQLNDSDLRSLVAHLCEREVRAQGQPSSAVTWGGHQNAADGGIDVRVTLMAGTAIAGHIPRAATGFQVKAQKMPRQAILEEMAPSGVVLGSIGDLAANAGAYVIVSSKESVSDSSLNHRKAAMAEAVQGLASRASLALDFYDSRRIASWVNLHPGLVPWVRAKLGASLSGWRGFEDWSSSPASVAASYLMDGHVRLLGPSIRTAQGLDAPQALALLREALARPKGVVRLVGLSGVGKTRLIQALFDERIGTDALPWSDALYSDISDSPDPAPQEMLSRLIHLGQRVILVVDNCGAELHRRLAAAVASSEGLLSLITVEYDITDDEPQDSEVFRLEPASCELIEKILESRYPGIEAPSRQVIARFSEGNARVAFALAATARHGESLGKLSDSELFRRLFDQQKAPNADLLNAGKACALLYSFDAETMDGAASELVRLAALAGQSVEAVYRHVAELHRRQLVQRRGRWRALLPHALANRLARLGLADVPLQKIEDVMIKGSPARMQRSFSRRIGYLHDDPRAVELAGRWFAAESMERSLGQLNELGEAIFENLACVNPPATLDLIEGAALRQGEAFFDERNRNRVRIARTLRSLAYDPALFDRAAGLLGQFACREDSKANDSTVDVLKSLFSMYLSGTHASGAQRAAFVRSLLDSGAAHTQALGLKLLDEMLKSSHFTAHHSFEFGAWKRDYGIRPATIEQVRQWYAQVIAMGQAAAQSRRELRDRIRATMARHVADLVRGGMVDEVTSMAERFAQEGGWPEGWIGVRIAMGRRAAQAPAALLTKLEALAARLRPIDLGGLIRAYAMSPEWGGLDVADFEGETSTPEAARRRIEALCVDLGRQLAVDSAQLASMLPEILAAESSRTFLLGQGVAASCESLAECWRRLREQFLQMAPRARSPQFLAGFLAAAHTRCPSDGEQILDDVLDDPRLHMHLLHWQVSAGVRGGAFMRLMEALTHDTVPLGSFRHLAAGRAHEALDDGQFHALVATILGKDDGSEVATEIMGMRAFGRVSEDLPVSEQLKETGRLFLARVVLGMRGHGDHMLGEVVKVAYDKPEHETLAREFCERILVAYSTYRISEWEASEVVTALASTVPEAVLDLLVEKARDNPRMGTTLIESMADHRVCPVDAMADTVWIAWAAQRPKTRFELLARTVRYADADGPDQAQGWSRVARQLIDLAPEPIQVLNAFYQRFQPTRFSGSFAENLAGRLSLIHALDGHANADIADWAAAHGPALAAIIEEHLTREAAENLARDQTFE